MTEKIIFNIKYIVISIVCGSVPFFILLVAPKILGNLIHSESLTAGWVLSICNFYLILWAWSRIFLKKRIALATSVIVIKYALLGIIIYNVALLKSNEIASFVIGLMSIIFMIIIYAVVQKK